MPTAPSSSRRSGKVVNGDAVLLAAGRALQGRRATSPGDIVVSTVMSNLGLEKALEARRHPHGAHARGR